MSVSPADVTALTKATDGFLCPLAANEYGIDFLNFTISDYESKKTIFEVGRDNPAPQDVTVDFSSLGEDMYRKIKYTFSEDVLRLPNIQTSLIFSVGPREMRSFRMIERHYFRDQVLVLVQLVSSHLPPSPPFIYMSHSPPSSYRTSLSSMYLVGKIFRL